jgi:tRNA(Ile)-lysidine synthase
MATIQLHHTKEFIRHLQADTVAIAWSGGLDSSVLVHYFQTVRPKINVRLLHFNHNTTPQDAEAIDFVLQSPLNANALRLHTQNGVGRKSKGTSWEEHWRNERLAFFKEWTSMYKIPVLTGHSLNDVAETWVQSCMTGTPKLIPYNYDGVVLRPLLTTERSVLEDYAVENNLTWYEDETNKDTKFARNKVRHDVLPDLLKHYPYMLNMLRRKIINRDNGNTPSSDE